MNPNLRGEELQHTREGRDVLTKLYSENLRQYNTSISGFISQLSFGTGVLHLIQIIHQPDATILQFIILKFLYSSTCFGRLPAQHQELNDCSGSLWFYLRIVVTFVLFWWSGQPARPLAQHGCHHDTNVRPEAATAVIELMMMGG
jgi:hypothetical protein